ncbi:hypothetical protein BKA64DRAFT_769692 [Cadophora sp. MPI-SDFR-AT-0126]|nr:hypothetical protein BKA64DRAFT_769692 [Leotiomycetes sp. MPI-SDFR-AT-0126]
MTVGTVIVPSGEHQSRNRDTQALGIQLHQDVQKLLELATTEENELKEVIGASERSAAQFIATYKETNKILLKALSESGICGYDDGNLRGVAINTINEAQKNVVDLFMVGSASRRDEGTTRVKLEFTEKMNDLLASILTKASKLINIRKGSHLEHDHDDVSNAMHSMTTAAEPRQSTTLVAADLANKLIKENAEIEKANAQLVKDLKASQEESNKLRREISDLRKEMSELRQENTGLHIYNCDLEECAEFCADVVAGWTEYGRERYSDGGLKILPGPRGRQNHQITSPRNDRVHAPGLRLVQVLFHHGFFKEEKDHIEFQFRFGCSPTDKITSRKEIEIRTLKAAGVNLFLGTELSYLKDKAKNREWIETLNKFEFWKSRNSFKADGSKVSVAALAKLCDASPEVEQFRISLREIYNNALSELKSETKPGSSS